MIRLAATTEKLQAVLGGAVATTQPQAIVCYSDQTASGYSGGVQRTALNSTTDVDILAAPAASTIRDVDYLSIYNRDTASVTVTIKYDVSATDSIIITVTLATLETLQYIHGSGWSCLDAAGNKKAAATQTLTGDVTGSGSGSIATTITANSVTNAKLAQMAANTIKGNNTGSTANAADLTIAQAAALLAGTEYWTKNSLINGGARIAMRPTQNLSTTAQYGQVDRCALWASGGAVSAGTIIQTTSSSAGTTGSAARVSGATLTGSGQISWRYRMESKDAAQWKNGTASFSIQVAHDVGSAINYTVIVRKPTVADNYAATTTIATSGATSVSSGVGTQVKFENISLGDCSNGLEIEVQAACGAVTTKIFDFTEWQLEAGAAFTVFERIDKAIEIIRCERYYEKNLNESSNPTTNNTALSTVVVSNSIADSGRYIGILFQVRKRAAPTVTIRPYTTASNTGRISDSAGTDQAASSGNTTSITESGFTLLNSSGGTITTTLNTIYMTWEAEAEL